MTVLSSAPTGTVLTDADVKPASSFFLQVINFCWQSSSNPLFPETSERIKTFDLKHRMLHILNIFITNIADLRKLKIIDDNNINEADNLKGWF